MVANAKPARPSADEVMDKLGARAPHLAEHCYLDRNWIWYCGPSLQKREADRAILKELGFRFGKTGHLMPDKKTIGTWAHSCQKPMFPAKRKPQPQLPIRSSHDELVALGL